MRSILDRIRTHAVSCSSSVAVLTPSQQVSYSQLQQLIECVADELLSLNINRLGLYGVNSLEWIVIDLAAATAGIAVVPIPLFFSSRQRQHLLDDSGIDTVFSSGELAELDDCANRIGSNHIKGEYQCLDKRPAITTGGDFCKVTYTSGSTGQPKGVCLSGNLIDLLVTSLSETLSEQGLNRHLCLIPFATLLENIAGVYLTLFMGGSLVVEDVATLGLRSNNYFDVEVFSAAITQHQPQSVILLPQMLKSIVEQGQGKDFSSLTFIAVGGGKVPKALLHQSRQLGLPVYEGYGLSECGSVVCLNTASANRPGSVGKPLPHTRVVVSDKGEIEVHGAAMLGYLNNDQSSSSIIATGDAGYLDEEGYLYITGRIKNTLVSSFGRNISPEWVESHFLAEPAIRQIAVFGEAKPHLSAVIHPVERTTQSQVHTLIQLINRELPDYAQVKHCCISTQPFSSDNGLLTDNGKLCREAIYQQFSEQLEYQEDCA
jgi:long-chain acyl-CoA synthetase